MKILLSEQTTNKLLSNKLKNKIISNEKGKYKVTTYPLHMLIY